MAKYLITYLGGKPLNTPEEGQAHFTKYKEWLDSFSDCILSPANPLKDTHTVNSDQSITEGSQIAMSGYTIIEVASMERALEVAKACPFLDIKGKLEVSELMEMNLS